MATIGHYSHGVADVLIATMAGAVAIVILFPLTVLRGVARRPSVGAAPMPAAAQSAVLSGLKTGCGQDCPPH